MTSYRQNFFFGLGNIFKKKFNVIRCISQRLRNFKIITSLKIKKSHRTRVRFSNKSAGFKYTRPLLVAAEKVGQRWRRTIARFSKKRAKFEKVREIRILNLKVKCYGVL